MTYEIPIVAGVIALGLYNKYYNSNVTTTPSNVPGVSNISLSNVITHRYGTLLNSNIQMSSNIIGNNWVIYRTVGYAVYNVDYIYVNNQLTSSNVTLSNLYANVTSNFVPVTITSNVISSVTHSNRIVTTSNLTTTSNIVGSNWVIYNSMAYANYKVDYVYTNNILTSSNVTLSNVYANITSNLKPITNTIVTSNVYVPNDPALNTVNTNGPPYDIGFIPSPLQPSILKAQDDYQAARGFPAPYKYETSNIVLYYGNRCITNPTHQQIINTVNTISEYFPKIIKDFDLTLFDVFKTTRKFPVYMLNSGLDPSPQDPASGIVGLASEYVAMFVPDIFKYNTDESKDVIVHELGHTLFHVKNNYWFEESLNEFMAHYYFPALEHAYFNFYNTLVPKSWLNPFGDTARTTTLYNYAALWRFICNNYGGPVVVGNIADFGIGQGALATTWDDLANYIKVPLSEILTNWLENLMTMRFWTYDATMKTALIRMRNIFATTAPHNTTDFIWTKPTCTTLSTSVARLEQCGFDVIAYTPNLENQLPATKLWSKVWVVNDPNGRYVSRTKPTTTAPMLMAYGWYHQLSPDYVQLSNKFFV